MLIAIALAMIAAVVVTATAPPARADHGVAAFDYSMPPRYGMDGAVPFWADSNGTLPSELTQN